MYKLTGLVVDLQWLYLVVVLIIIIIMDNLNCKAQAHASVCEENKLELKEKNDTYWNNFVVKDMSLKDHIGRVG